MCGYLKKSLHKRSEGTNNSTTIASIDQDMQPPIIWGLFWKMYSNKTLMGIDNAD